MTGNSGVVQVALTGGTVATVGEIRSFSIEETADTVESTSMGDISRTFTHSFRSGTISIEPLFAVATAGSNQPVLDVS